MGSGMNIEQAKEYAKTMTYSKAVSNVRYSKGIKYRKATMIKLRELSKIADMLDRNCETCRFDDKYGDESICSNCSRRYSDCYEPKDEHSGEATEMVEDEPSEDCELCKHFKYRHPYWECEFDTFEECNYEPKDEPQTDCAWKKGEE